MAQLGADGVPADADVTDPEDVAAALEAGRPSAVVHLAARSSVGESWSRATDVWRVNVLGTVNVLEAVREQAPDARVLIVSSGEAYGETRHRPARETDPLAPVSPYAGSKAAAEVAALRAARADGLDVVVTRPFPHAGPGQSARFAIGSWTSQVARLEVSGGGVLHVGNTSVERDLLDVRDVCRAYELLLDPAVPAGVYNVASGEPVTLSDVVETLVGMARSPIAVEEEAGRFRTTDLRVLAGDATRLRATTGWQRTIQLEQTLADALDDARMRLAESEGVPT